MADGVSPVVVGTGDRQAGKEGRNRHSNLGIGGGYPALALGHVGPSLEQGGRQSSRYRWHIRSHRGGSDREIGRLLSYQDRDGVLQDGALQGRIDLLRLAGQ